MRVIQKYNIPFADILTTERAVLETADLSAFSALSVTDYISSLELAIGIDNRKSSAAYVQFMDSVFLYCLINDHYSYNMSTICLLSSLAYFIARHDDATAERVEHILRVSVGAKSKEAIRLNAHVEFVLSSLKELGVCDEDISHISVNLTREI